MKRNRIVGAAIAGLVAVGVVGCSAPSTPNPTPAEEVHLGYFANVTHAPALVALENGYFADELGETELATEVFNAGPATIEAISAGAIDAAYIGPSPAINSFIKSRGASVVVVSGVTSGGASLVVRDGIDSVRDLEGSTLATPQLGNTQDVALRSWLASEGLESSITGGGDVTIQPSENADTLALFTAGSVDGAWLPEPWASRLVLEAGAHVLIDEAELWPDGEFPTTLLIVNKDFFAAHPQTVEALVAANLAAVSWLGENPDAAAGVINKRIAADTGKPLADDVIARALKSVHFTTDPIASAFTTLVDHAVAAGTGIDGSLDGLFDLTALNAKLSAAGLERVSAAGLGKE